MTDKKRVPGFPVLITRTSQTPYRVVLAPPLEFGIDRRRIGTLLASAAGKALDGPYPRSGVSCKPLGGVDWTVFWHIRLLQPEEVGLDQPALDQSSRPIRVSEGMVFRGRWAAELDDVLAAGRAQLSAAIAANWEEGDPDVSPRTADAIECLLHATDPDSKKDTPRPDVPDERPPSPDDAQPPEIVSAVGEPQRAGPTEPADSLAVGSGTQPSNHRGARTALMIAGLLGMVALIVLLVVAIA